jgi:hypothetical protein
MKDEATINLSVTLDEANLILEGLGQLPFVRVYRLIARLQEQGSRQVSNPDTERPPRERAPLAAAE